MNKKNVKRKINFNINCNLSRAFLILLLTIEIAILILNIDKLIKFSKKKLFPVEFREIDYHYLRMFSSTFEEISKNLTQKFYPKPSLNKALNDTVSINATKTKLKVYYKNINIRWINLIREDIKEKFEIEIDENNPDYLIYATFGCEHMLNKYNNTIKIAFFTENQLPDLNFADYAIGLGHINHLDRFFTFPYIVYYLKRRKITPQKIDFIRNKVLNSEKREKFCAAVISNPTGLRLKFIKKLNKIKKIDMGGRYRNNVGGPIRHKIRFLSKYKFSIAMENSEGDGYASEKIIDSFLAGTIPIYFGDYMIDEYINPKTYILIRNRKDIMKKIEYIMKIDNDDNLYRSILKEKVFIDDFFVDNIINERKKFLLHIFDQKKEYAKRVDKYHFNYRKK